MFGRETIIALRARRQAHRIATDILLPRLHLPERPFIVADEESREDDEWFDSAGQKRESTASIWLFVYISLLLLFGSLVVLIASILNSFLIVK